MTRVIKSCITEMGGRSGRWPAVMMTQNEDDFDLARLPKDKSSLARLWPPPDHFNEPPDFQMDPPYRIIFSTFFNSSLALNSLHGLPISQWINCNLAHNACHQYLPSLLHTYIPITSALPPRIFSANLVSTFLLPLVVFYLKFPPFSSLLTLTSYYIALSNRAVCWTYRSELRLRTH